MKKTKKKKKEIDRSSWPIVAICYDFDKTLSPQDMQNYSLIPETGKTIEEFWEGCGKIAKENKMDSILVYMHEIIKIGNIESSNLKLTHSEFKKHGKKIQLYNGVTTWFKRIQEFADRLKIRIEHYIISAGIQEIIEGTSIAKNFKQIFASSFYYNKKTKIAEWPAQIVNATSKTQYLFRISKGCLDMSDEKKVHKAVNQDELRIPFRNIIYIGDSITDIPAMRVVTKEGGISIGVYNTDNNEPPLSIYVLKRDERINYYAPADYSKDSVIEKLIKDILTQKQLQFLSEAQTKDSEIKIEKELCDIFSQEEIDYEKARELISQKNFAKVLLNVLDGTIKKDKSR